MSSEVLALEGALAKDVMFVDAKGRVTPAVEKRQRTLLAKAAPLLRVVLEPGERVLLLTEATSPFSIMEFLTTGWIITAVKRCLLVATDRRLLHLPVKINLENRLSISEARYADLAEIKVRSGLGTKLSLKYRDGAKEEFGNLRGGTAARLRQIVEGRAGHGQPTAHARRAYLCPRCTRALPTSPTTCPGCNLAFRTRAKAIQRSLLLPGGGYFYTGHPFLGLGDAVTETFLTVLVLVFLASALDGDPEGWGLAAITGVLLLVEKLLTIYHASHYVREVMPADRGFRLS